MVRDLAHVTIDLETVVSKTGVTCDFELFEHVVDIGVRRLGAMRFPHHHRH